MGSGSKYYAIKNRFDKTDTTTTEAGIYLGTRKDNNGITYGYVGQTLDLHQRRWEYYQVQCGLAYPKTPFQASLKKHKDYVFQILETCGLSDLDEREKYGVNVYLAKPFHETRNTTLTRKDRVLSNYKRIEQISKRFDDKIVKCIHNVYTSLDSNGLLIKPKTKKDGTPTKLSLRYFNELLELLKIGK